MLGLFILLSPDPEFVLYPRSSTLLFPILTSYSLLLSSYLSSWSEFRGEPTRWR
jgi:hypothetical protein